jgi:hypothetical protein
MSTLTPDLWSLLSALFVTLLNPVLFFQLLYRIIAYPFQEIAHYFNLYDGRAILVASGAREAATMGWLDSLGLSNASIYAKNSVAGLSSAGENTVPSSASLPGAVTNLRARKAIGLGGEAFIQGLNK